MLTTMTGTTSMDAFERMKEKVEAMEVKAEVAGELAASGSGPDLDIRFKALTDGSKVEEELARLKKMLPGPRAQLPSGEEVKLPTAQMEAEYQRMKREMGR
jgi:phage shock protein A